MWERRRENEREKKREKERKREEKREERREKREERREKRREERREERRKHSPSRKKSVSNLSFLWNLWACVVGQYNSVVCTHTQFTERERGERKKKEEEEEEKLKQITHTDSLLPLSRPIPSSASFHTMLVLAPRPRLPRCPAPLPVALELTSLSPTSQY